MKTTQYAVTGRISGDDEDTLLILTLPDTANSRDVVEAFKAEMLRIEHENSNDEVEGIYVNTIVQGDNLARIL